MINYPVLGYFLTFAAGFCFAKWTSPKVVFDYKTREGYIQFRNKKLHLTRFRVGRGCGVFFDEEPCETHFGFAYGLPNQASQDHIIRLQRLIGDKLIEVKQKDSLHQKFD